MPTLGAVSQNIRDQFFQDFEPENSFIGEVQVDFWVAATYGEIIQNYFQANYAQNLAETGYGTVDLSTDWMLAENQEVKEDAKGWYVELDNQPFSFLFDNQITPVHTIIPTKGNTCGEFKRLSLKELWKLRILPITSIVWWYYIPCQIRFEKMKCRPKEVTVYYLPAMGDEINPNFMIPDGIASQIMKAVLNVMFAASKGKTIDTTTDGNPNTAPQTESNTLFPNIKTK